MKSSKNFLLFVSASLVILILFVMMNMSSSNQNLAGEDLVAEGYNTDLSGNLSPSEKYAYFRGDKVSIPPEVLESDNSKEVLSAVSESKWIEVDLSDQKLYAWEGNRLFLETLISSGLSGTPTPEGEFRIWIKLRAAKMEGGSGRGYYYLPNVPYIMYFENSKIPGWRGYGLHGTYWHNDFGRPKSHGCVNLPTPVAKTLYEWVGPVLSDGKNMVRSGSDNPGTRIVVHQ